MYMKQMDLWDTTGDHLFVPVAAKWTGGDDGDDDNDYDDDDDDNDRRYQRAKMSVCVGE